MKPLTPLLFVATALSASAFSVDFIGLENDIDLSEGNFSFDNTDGNQLVRGAFDEEGGSPGNVLFGAPTGTTAEVSLTSEGAAIELDANDVILVSFIVGGAVENVQLSFIGEDKADFNVPVFTSTGADTGSITLPAGATEATAITGLTFDISASDKKIPEPSVSILGALGVLFLLRRNR